MKQGIKMGAGRKLAVFAAVAALVFGMNVSVMADQAAELTNGVAVSSSTTLNIPKTLVVTNPALGNVAGPGLQLTYTLQPTAAKNGWIVTDSEGNTEPVLSGETGGLRITSSPAFSATELLNASQSGTPNVKNIVLETDLTKFAEPGIYRYTLTDTTESAALTAAGVDRNEHFTTVRYVDVYIMRNTVTNDLEVEGYVVGSDNDPEGANGVLVKETFDNSTTTDDTTSDAYASYPTPDVFNTHNTRLTKSVTGAMGDKHHEFPFAISVSHSGRKIYASEGTAPGATSELTVDASTNTLSANLKDGETYYLAGLRKNDTVAYTETNNTLATYSVSITGVNDATNAASYAASNVSPNGTKSMAAVTAPNAENVTYVNNLGSISPTGVITRFGPYIGMILIAAVLLVVRRRAHNR